MLVLFCQEGSQYLPLYLIIHIYPPSHHYHSLPSLSALFFLNWKPFPSSSLSSLICMTPLLWTILCYLHLSLCHHSPITPLFCMFPRQKPYFIHPTPVSSLSHTLPPSSLSPTTHSRLFFPAALSTRRDVCVYHTLISADTCSTLLSLLFPLYPHTHIHRCTEGDEGKA